MVGRPIASFNIAQIPRILLGSSACASDVTSSSQNLQQSPVANARVPRLVRYVRQDQSWASASESSLGVHGFPLKMAPAGCYCSLGLDGGPAVGAVRNYARHTCSRGIRPPLTLPHRKNVDCKSPSSDTRAQPRCRLLHRRSVHRDRPASNVPRTTTGGLRTLPDAAESLGWTVMH
jgi:hypothetical protein